MNDAQMVAMLRHLYAQLILKGEKEVADGLLSPAIRSLEARIKEEAQQVGDSGQEAVSDPDGYLEHTEKGDFLAYGPATINPQTPLYTLEKARAILALSHPAQPAGALQERDAARYRYLRESANPPDIHCVVRDRKGYAWAFGAALDDRVDMGIEQANSAAETGNG